MKKLFNVFLMLRAFGFAALVGLIFGSTAISTLAVQERGGGSYTSPTFVFTVSWDDDVWEANELTEAEGVELNSDLSYGLIQGFGEYELGAEGCLEDSVASMESQDHVSDFGAAPRKMERPATSEDAVGELYQYLDLENDTEIALYIECRELPVDAAVLQVILLSYKQDFADAIGAWEDLLAEVNAGAASDSKDDDSGKVGKGSSKSGIDGNVYTNVEAGFSASWDQELWSVRKTNDDEGLGIGVELETEVSIGWITGDPYDGDLETCASDFAESVGTYETISKMRKAAKSYEVPSTDRDAIGGLYAYTDVTEDPVKMVAYFECRWAGEDEFVVTVLLATPKEFYEDELPLWEELIDGISVDAVQDVKTEDDDSKKDKKGKKDQSENDEPVAVKGTTISGANHGFELTYDGSFWTVDDLSDVNTDFLDLSSELAIGSVIAFDMPYDGAQCLQVLAELKQGEGVTDFAVAPNSVERPRTSRSADGELFTYTFDGQNGPIDAVTYIECRSIDGGAATLGVMFLTVPSVYPDALPVFETLLAGISTGAGA